MHTMNRRCLLIGALSVLAAPAVIRTPRLLMPVKPVICGAPEAIAWRDLLLPMMTVQCVVPGSQKGWTRFRSMQILVPDRIGILIKRGFDNATSSAQERRCCKRACI